VAAGRANALRRRDLSEAGPERLRAAAPASRPWGRSTGPTTPEGKRRAAANGRALRKGALSVRELRSELAGCRAALRAARAARARAAAAG
jgi:hypothetical protein